MSHFLRNLFAKVQAKSLSRTDALDMLKQHYAQRNDAGLVTATAASASLPHTRSNKYSIKLAERDFYVSDHVVEGATILPGAVYLEMACRAFALSGSPEAERLATTIRQVVWMRPLEIKSFATVNVDLCTHENGAVEFKIFTVADRNDQVVLHAQGFISDDSRAAIINRDLASAHCGRSIDIEEFYRRLANSGLQHGPGLRGITELRVNEENGEPLVIARAQIPESVGATRDDFMLHPSILDAALQATAGVAWIRNGDIAAVDSIGARPSLPFTLERLNILMSCPSNAWIVVRYRQAGSPETLYSEMKLDIDICDRDGRVCVRLEGLTTLPVGDSSNGASGIHHGIDALTAPSLLARNVQSHSVIRELSAEDFYLQDHHQDMPGVMYLELAREVAAAYRHAPVIGIKHVVWPAPLSVAQGVCALRIEVSEQKDVCRFVATTSPQAIAGRENLHVQGELVFDQSQRPDRPKPLNIDAVLSSCTASLTAAQCDEMLGAKHGSRMLSISSLSYNEREAVAILDVSSSPPEAVYELHPSHMHGAVISAMTFASIRDATYGQRRLPFELGEVWIYSAIPKRAYAYIRNSGIRSLQGQQAHDIDIVDDLGRCVIAIRGLVDVLASTNASNDVLYAVPVWQECALARSAAASLMDDPIFVFSREDEELQLLLNEEWRGANFELLPANESNPAEAPVINFLSVLTLLQSCLHANSHRMQPLCILVPENGEVYKTAAIAGLLRTAELESSHVLCKFVRYSAVDRTSKLLLREQLKEELNGFDRQVEIRYSGGQRERRTWQEQIPKSARGLEISIPSDCVIWITGGLGGLGRIVARHLGAVTSAKIVVSGRSAWSDLVEQKIASCRSAGVNIQYVQCDVSDLEQVKIALQRIQTEYGKLAGIIHCAGITRDSLIKNKVHDDVRAVFSPKVSGVLALDKATRNLDLDFLIFFSSLSAFTGNRGQSDYAGANAFLDEFAEYRNRLASQGRRRGRTLSIQWPLWREGGMQMDAHTENTINELSGIEPLPTSVGLQALDFALRLKESRMLVVQGDRQKIRNILSLEEAEQLSSAPRVAQQVIDVHGHNSASLHGIEGKEAIRELIRETKLIAARLMKIPESELSGDIELSRYGFDSISLTEFANQLNRRYELELMPTVFFQCSTLDRLAHYLMKHHPTKFVGATRLGVDATISNAHATQAQVFEFAKRIPLVLGRKLPINKMDAAAVPEPIAIIGMSGRFPGSADVNELWTHLEANDDLITEVPLDRWDWRDYYGDALAEKYRTVVKSGGFIADVDCFDSMFFGISPREAVSMDPQQRLFIESSWSCVEDAGYRATELAGSRTGVFVGVTNSDYRDMSFSSELQGEAEGAMSFHFMIANRVSYIFDFHGPSESIDTACSSSLVAIHRAIQSIRSDECEMALVGGVNVIASPAITIRSSQAGVLSEDGKCKSFDQSANGYGRGEGVATLLLKPLSKARREGDHIYGLLRGSAVNHGGKATSPTAPNPLAQEELIVSAMRDASIDVGSVNYIEAHGTGTVLGDPIEINALKAAFAKLYERSGEQIVTAKRCAVGTVKTSIGHLEAAAGIAGVVKVLLMIKHRKIPGNVHLREPNSYLQLDGTPFYLAKETHKWEPGRDQSGAATPLRAGVSSFGIGGANAHVLLEEFVSDENSIRAPLTDVVAQPALILLSAKATDQLRDCAANLLRFCETRRIGDKDIADIAYTLQLGRESLEHRLAFAADSAHQLKQVLQSFLDTRAESRDAAPRLEYFSGDTRNKTSASVLFSKDEELSAVVATWFAKRRYDRLLELWVTGFDIDWRKLYVEEVRLGRLPKRISLPTYPFAKRRHWLKSDSSRRSPMESKGDERTLVFGSQTTKLLAISNDAKPQGIGLSSIDPQRTNKNLSTLDNDVRSFSAATQKPSTALSSLPENSNSSARLTRDELTVSLAQALYIHPDQIDLRSSFVEMGLDSILGVEWIRHVNKTYQLAIATTKLYDYPNLTEFAAYVHRERQRDLSAPMPAVAVEKATYAGRILRDLAAKKISVEVAAQLLRVADNSTDSIDRIL